jgi:hypothetical protein
MQQSVPQNPQQQDSQTLLISLPLVRYEQIYGILLVDLM